MKDNGGFNKKGLCKLCKEPRTPDGDDPCIANLPGVLFACCGHGIESGYIKFTNGKYIKFNMIETELDLPKHLIVDNPVPVHTRGDVYRRLNFQTREITKKTATHTIVPREDQKFIRDGNVD